MFVTHEDHYLSKVYALRLSTSNDQFVDMSYEEEKTYTKDGTSNSEFLPHFNGFEYTVYQLPNFRLCWNSLAIVPWTWRKIVQQGKIILESSLLA